MVSKQPERKITKFAAQHDTGQYSSKSVKILNEWPKQKCLWFRLFARPCVAVSVTDGIIFFWSSRRGSLGSFTLSENFIRSDVWPRKIPTIFGNVGLWELATKIKVVFQKGAVGKILIQKCCKTLIATWFFALNRITNCFFCTFLCYQLFSLDNVSVFLIFSLALLIASVGMFENRGKENKGRTAGPKTQKAKLGQNVGQARIPNNKPLPITHLGSGCNIQFMCLLRRVYSSSTKMSMILRVSILLNCSRARIAVVNSSRVTWEQEIGKEEEIPTNLSILILVHLSEGAWGDEFFWSLGIKLWPLSVSIRPLFLWACKNPHLTRNWLD